MTAPRDRRPWYGRYRRHCQAAIAVGVSLTLSIVAFVFVRHLEVERTQNEFEHCARLVAVQFKQAIDISLDDLYFIADFFTA